MSKMLEFLKFAAEHEDDTGIPIGKDVRRVAGIAAGRGYGEVWGCGAMSVFIISKAGRAAVERAKGETE